MNEIDEYIIGFPADVQIKLKTIRKLIRECVPDAVEAFKYKMPTFVLKRNLVHFAAFKNHIGFYPTPSGIENFADELSQYKTSKGAIQFPLDQPLPLNLIRNIVLFRVKEEINRSKKKSH
ncbi:MAG: DUF1801 domain-containing protein [Candidatus Heimdallarchaeota archaeon]|nr:DUF1801 domain-containing protein [Candidatus Heimdallarchaeota archaeon]